MRRHRRTGFIGRALALRLAASGTRVLALVRDTARAGDLAATPGIELVRGDLRDPALLRELTGRAGIIYHLAGLTSARSRGEFMAVNAEVTGALAAAAASSPAPPKLVLVSSLSVAGPRTAARPAREDDPPAPVNSYGESKLLGEELLRRNAARAPLDHRAPALGLRSGRPGDPRAFPAGGARVLPDRARGVHADFAGARARSGRGPGACRRLGGRGRAHLLRRRRGGAHRRAARPGAARGVRRRTRAARARVRLSLHGVGRGGRRVADAARRRCSGGTRPARAFSRGGSATTPASAPNSAIAPGSASRGVSSRPWRGIVRGDGCDFPTACRPSRAPRSSAASWRRRPSPPRRRASGLREVVERAVAESHLVKAGGFEVAKAGEGVRKAQALRILPEVTFNARGRAGPRGPRHGGLLAGLQRRTARSRPVLPCRAQARAAAVDLRQARRDRDPGARRSRHPAGPQRPDRPERRLRCLESLLGARRRRGGGGDSPQHAPGLRRAAARGGKTRGRRELRRQRRRPVRGQDEQLQHRSPVSRRPRSSGAPPRTPCARS